MQKPDPKIFAPQLGEAHVVNIVMCPF